MKIKIDHSKYENQIFALKFSETLQSLEVINFTYDVGDDFIIKFKKLYDLRVDTQYEYKMNFQYFLTKIEYDSKIEVLHIQLFKEREEFLEMIHPQSWLYKRTRTLVSTYI